MKQTKYKARDFGFDKAIDFPKGSFDLSQTRQGSYDMGVLYPVYVNEMLPGDTVEMSNIVNMAFNPTVSAVRHEVNATIDWYFVPYGAMPNITAAEQAALAGMTNAQKLTYYDPRYGFRNQFWQTLITGGFDGLNTDTMASYTPVAADLNPGSLWDHFGLPMTIAGADYSSNKVIAALFTAYNMIWNWNYRDENWQSAKNPTGATVTVAGDPSMTIVAMDNTTLLNADWEKDYFTTALKDQQRGAAQAVTVQGVGQAVWAAAQFTNTVSSPSAVSVEGANATTPKLRAIGGTNETTNLQNMFNTNTLSVSGLGVDIAKLRLSIATQRVLERNARAGARETEFYRAHYGDGPTDNRGDQPDFIGRYRQPITFADVVNTSVAGTPAAGTDPTIATQTMGFRQSQGDGQGMGGVGTFHCKEFGILMAVMCIRPRALYYQKTEKYWFGGRGKFDFPLPEFANLSEQAVLCRELAPATAATTTQVFGYQGRYDEYRQKVNDAVGLLRPTGATGSNANLRSWNFGRSFAGVPVQGDTFLKVDPAVIKPVNFAYTNASVPMLIGTVGNIVQVRGRPLPQIAQPGLMDHI
ncbi:MAG: major capsid protein [Microvirus sp.]|nr:MAG: major capsid protein [Microvirus sp.]